MAGYKKVSFYEICRLCSSFDVKDKVHIFHEEGKKMELQCKLQTCLSLKVSENDYLPKVVCAKCLQNLEACYEFRQDCLTSETMLSNYYKKFRCTADFESSGKVYIKDNKFIPGFISEANLKPITKSTSQRIFKLNGEDANINKASENADKSEEIHIALDSPNKEFEAAVPSHDNNFQKLVNGEIFNNFVVNANGVLNFDQLIEIDSILTQAIHQKDKESEETLNKSTKSTARSLPKTCDQLFEYNSIVSQVPSDDKDISTNNIVKTTAKMSPTNYDTGQKKISRNEEQFNIHFEIKSLVKSKSSKSAEIIDYTTIKKTHNHNASAKPNLMSSNKSSKTYSCNLCSKTFKRREHLYQHAKLHSGFRPYCCQQCPKSFMRKEHLMRHNTLHSGQKNFLCDICSKSFSRNDNLLKHKKIHQKHDETSTTKYVCEICDKNFILKHNFIAHKMTHELMTSVWS